MNIRFLFILCAMGLFSQVVFRKSEPPGYTIVINTFRDRDQNLYYLADTYHRCKSVKQIIVMWNDIERDPPRGLRGTTVLVPNQNVISNRFNIKNLMTDAVFHVDDDLMYSCDVIEDAFKVWSENPDSMVGFAPRLLTDGPGRLNYKWKGAYKQGKFNTGWVTKGGFVHRKYMDMYSMDESYDKIRRLVDDYTTGEDILMSLINKERGEGFIPLEVLPGQYRTMRDTNKKITLNSRSGKHRGSVMREITRYLRAATIPDLFEDSKELDWLSKTKVMI